MKERIKAFYLKHKQLIIYLLFGVITTVVSLAACFITLELGVVFLHDERGEPTELLDIIGSTVQWISGVLIAFFTNKLWVFKCAEHGCRATLRQFGVFCGSRVGTYFLEVAINLAGIAAFEFFGYRTILLSIFGMGIELSSRLWAKMISSVLVVISNYYISKFLVFKNKEIPTTDSSI